MGAPDWRATARSRQIAVPRKPKIMRTPCTSASGAEMTGARAPRRSSAALRPASRETMARSSRARRPTGRRGAARGGDVRSGDVRSGDVRSGARPGEGACSVVACGGSEPGGSEPGGFESVGFESVGFEPGGSVRGVVTSGAVVPGAVDGPGDCSPSAAPSGPCPRLASTSPAYGCRLHRRERDFSRSWWWSAHGTGGARLGR